MRYAVRGFTRSFSVLAIAAATGLPTLLRAQPATQPTTAGARKVFADSVVPIPAQEGLTPSGLMVHAAEPKHKDDQMDVLFSLSIPKEAQDRMEAMIAKGEVISPDVLERDYSPKQADVDALTAWLKEQGFTVTDVSRDRTSVYARASVARIEKSLQVQMTRVSRDGVTYNAARNAPSLPAGVGDDVRAIIGLQPFRHAHKQSRIQPPRGGNRTLRTGDSDELAVTTPSASAAGPSPAIANAPPYLVKEMLRAYNADKLGVTGAGQKIAILIDTFPDRKDLEAFWKQNNLPVTIQNVELINVKGGPLPPREGEETLDVEWATGIAPGATVRVYASGSLNWVDLNRALDRIIDDLAAEPNMRQVSISLGLGETFMPGGEADAEHKKFNRLAIAGVNVFVSSGDAGSNPDETGHSHGTAQQAEYMSSDPAVIGVGGTRLNLSATGEVGGETAWSESGGGSSILFNRPQWQSGAGVPDGTKRLVPDVGLAADPDTGAFVVFQGQTQQIGGTSWSAPTWAGFCALMNESRVKAGKQPLPFLNPLIYPLIGTPCFRDMTQGNNGAYDAQAGYDMVTGIGVPNVQELAKALANK